MNRFAVTALKILVSGVLLGFLFHRISLSPVIARLVHLKPGIALLLLVLGAGQIALFAERWKRVGEMCGAPFSFIVNLRLTLIGLFFNQTLPSSIGGDAVRVWLSTRMGVPAGRAFSSVVADRLVALITLLGISLATLPLFFILVTNPVLRHSLATLLAIAAAGFAMFLIFGSRIAKALRSWRFSRPFGIVIEDLRRIFLRPAGIVIVVLSGLIHMASIMTVFLIAAMLGIDLSAGAALVLVPPILLILIIPITIAGWGLRETAMVVALAQIHVPAPDALAISIVFGLLQILVSLPGALLWLQRHDSVRAISSPDA